MDTLHITPYDTLFVRDGKPFSMGEEVWANGLFPPPPSVIYGALRGHYFSHHTDELIWANTPNDPTEAFRLRYNRIVDKNAGVALFPVPADIMAIKGQKGHFCTLQLEDAPQFSNFQYPKVLKTQETVEEVESGFLTNADIEMYLSGDFVSGRLGLVNDVWVREPKIGIMKSRETGSSEEGRMYRTGMFRFNSAQGSNQSPYALEIGINNLSTTPKGMLRLGGEGKMATFAKQDNSLFDWKPQDEVIRKGEVFKVYLLTPAIYEKGVVGNWIDDSVKLLTVALHRAMPLGGFDMKGKGPNPKPGPKSLRKAVPAGTVYYLEAQEDVPVSKFDQQNLSDELSEQGMGFALVAKLQNNTEILWQFKSSPPLACPFLVIV